MTRSIYVIDDDAAVCTSLCGLLSVRPTIEVQSFNSGDAFLAAINDLEPGVLLLDYHMPGASGLDVLHAIRKRGSSFAAVILTGRGDVALAIEAMRAGAVLVDDERASGQHLEQPRAPLGPFDGQRRVHVVGGQVEPVGQVQFPQPVVADDAGRLLQAVLGEPPTASLRLHLAPRP